VHYLFLGPRGGHPRRSSYADRIITPPQKASTPSARSAVPLLDEILIAHEKTLQSEPRSPGRDHTDATRTPGGPLPGATAAGKPAAPRPVPRLTESRPVTCERGLHVWV
jgi:hypothetical protein